MGAMVTEEQKLEYVKNGGRNCPRCGSINLEGGPWEVNESGGTQEIFCVDCKLAWLDEYKLNGIHVLET